MARVARPGRRLVGAVNMAIRKLWRVRGWHVEVFTNTYCLLVGVNLFTGRGPTNGRGVYIHLGPLIVGVWK